MNSALAHPIDLVRTFTADAESGKLLSLDDILKKGKRELFEAVQTGDVSSLNQILIWGRGAPPSKLGGSPATNKNAPRETDN